MKALKRFKETKSQRDNKQLISLALEHYLLASALVLHDEFGFGKERFERFGGAMMRRMEEIIDYYGSDCLLVALREKCKSLGIEVDI